MKNKTSKILAIIASLAIASTTFMSIPVYAEDEPSAEDIFNEEMFADEPAAGESSDEELAADDMEFVEIDDSAPLIDEIETNEKAASVTDSYSTAQKAAYDKITAACDEFLDSSVTLSTNAFKVITLDTALSFSDISTVVSDIKASDFYNVLDGIGLFSTAGNDTYDKLTLFTKKDYRTADGREAAKPVQKPAILSTEAGDGEVAIKWAAVKGATTYRLFKVEGKTFTRIKDTTATEFTVTGLTNGTKYGFVVLAYVNGAWTGYTQSDIVYDTPSVK